MLPWVSAAKDILTIVFLSPTKTKQIKSLLTLIAITTDNNSIITNWYRKNPTSGRYINYLSHHPQSRKIAIIYNLVDKSIKLSDPQFHQENLHIVKHYLRCNSYPEHIINKYIKSRLKAIKNNFSPSNLTNKRAVLFKDKIVLPFIKHLTLKINHILHKHNIIPINKTINKFNNIIILGKDRLDKSDTYGIVYKIDCQNCSSTYIGISKRKLKKRTCEHVRAVKNCSNNSALAVHVEKTAHTINFNNIKIIDKETNFFKRSFSEMLNIYFHNNTLNHIDDT